MKKIGVMVKRVWLIILFAGIFNIVHSDLAFSQKFTLVEGNEIELNLNFPPSLNINKIFLDVHEKRSLLVNNMRESYIYKWKSNNENIANVSNTGQVIAIKRGIAVITCEIIDGLTQEKYNIQCLVVVSDKNKTIITTNSKPFDHKFIKSKDYNSNTKHYFIFRSAFERMEKKGGGTILIKKGTYTITNTLAIPSNVIVILEDGVILKKGSKTGTKNLKASQAMFHFVKPSKLKTSKYYKKHDGEKNIYIVGKGTAQIDLLQKQNALAFVIGHNQNIFINNITFKNLNNGHFIELDATKNIYIDNCKFLNSVKSTKGNKEAINLDTPDFQTGGFNNIWSAQDKTPNENIIITNCKFKSIDVAIGTHRYSQDDGKNMYHNNIFIQGNSFEGMRMTNIHIINWSNVIIENNTFINSQAFLAKAVVDFTFKQNTIVGVNDQIADIWGSTSDGTYQIYARTYSTLTNENLQDLYNNTAKNSHNSYIRISKGIKGITQAYENYIQLKQE